MKKFKDFSNELNQKMNEGNKNDFFDDLVFPLRAIKDGIYDQEGKLVFKVDVSRSGVDGADLKIVTDFIIDALN